MSNSGLLNELRKRRPPQTADRSGWLQRWDERSIPDDRHPLAAHVNYTGPTKLVLRKSGPVALTEVRLPKKRYGADEFAGGDEWSELVGDLSKSVFSARRRRYHDWDPPETDELEGWLREMGREPVVDQSDTLRLALPGRGCDGQVRITRRQGFFRMTMVLGDWKDLHPVSEAAIQRVASSANAGCRLVRIGWCAEGVSRRVEAQVDFTGLPVRPQYGGFWRENLGLALSGMELAQRRLGLEVDVLAQPENLGLAARLSGEALRPPRRPK